MAYRQWGELSKQVRWALVAWAVVGAPLAGLALGGYAGQVGWIRTESAWPIFGIVPGAPAAFALVPAVVLGRLRGGPVIALCLVAAFVALLLFIVLLALAGASGDFS